MQPDAVRVEDVKAWLGKAGQDLRRVEVLLALTPPDLEDALFHCQQTAEKAFKAFLTWHDVAFRRIHELDTLGGQCADLDSTLADLVGRADVLTKYATQFRYPGAPYEPSSAEVEAARALARQVYQAILDRLPAETHQ
jgi:HEPN domain-containing protein